MPDFPRQSDRNCLSLETTLTTKIATNVRCADNPHIARRDIQRARYFLAAAIRGIIIGPKGYAVIIIDKADRTVGFDETVMHHPRRKGILEDVGRFCKPLLHIPFPQLKMVAYVRPRNRIDARSMTVASEFFMDQGGIRLSCLGGIEYRGQFFTVYLDQLKGLFRGPLIYSRYRHHPFP